MIEISMVGSCLGEIVDVLSGENVVGEVGGGGVSTRDMLSQF